MIKQSPDHMEMVWEDHLMELKMHATEHRCGV